MLAAAPRELPGFGELMRAESLKQVPTAIPSRQLAAHRGALPHHQFAGQTGGNRNPSQCCLPGGALLPRSDRRGTARDGPRCRQILPAKIMTMSAASTQDETAEERFRALVGGYRPLANVPDEFIGPDGQPRSHWLKFFHALSELGADEIDRRFATADRNIRDTGVSYRAYADTSERAWPLSHLPLLIEADEWHAIAAGVTQHAQLLEAVARDIYGPAEAGRKRRPGLPPPSLAALTTCRSFRACSRYREISSISMPPTLAAGRTENGGSSATARKRLRPPAMRPRIPTSATPGPSRRSTAI